MTDFYAFVSREDPTKAVVVMNVYGLQSPFGGPNYYSLSDSHYYELHVSCNEGDAKSAHVFQFSPGARLGGPASGSPISEIDEDQSACEGSAVTEQTSSGYRTGVAVNVANIGEAARMVEIPLKVFGQLGIQNGQPTVGSGQVNWQEYYHLRYRKNYDYTNPNADPAGWVSVVPQSPLGSDAAEFLVPFNYVGEKTFPAQGSTSSAEAYEEYARKFIANTNNFMTCGTASKGVKVFVGQRAESFNIDLGRTFDLLNYVHRILK